MKALLGVMFLCCVGGVACYVAMTVITYQAKQYDLTVFYALLGCMPLIAAIGVTKIWQMEMKM